MGDLTPLSMELGSALLVRNYMLSTAESCTGGWVAKLVTDVAGSSRWFDRGFVTYSNEAKMDMLGVPPEVFIEDGAVSEVCARAMVRGALENSRAQMAVAITGIAGPDGGSVEKPVGTVWIAWALEEELLCRRFQFEGDREQVRKASVEQALRGLLNLL